MPEELFAAAQQLAKSQRGRDALRRMLDWLDATGLGLDADNKAACLTLLDAAWGKYPMSARDAMREALE